MPFELLLLAGRKGGDLMTEYIIAEDEYRAAMRKAYEAGAAGREAYTARDYLTRELVRCKDCAKYATEDCPLMSFKRDHDSARIADNPFAAVNMCVYCPGGYCAWGERKDCS